MARHALIALVLAAGCTPRLYSDGVLSAYAWVAPENDWPITTPPEGIVGEGFFDGQVVPDVRGVDQHGNQVSLWQFAGRHVLLDVSAMWCAPCQELGAGTEHIYQEYLEHDVVYLTVIQQDVEGNDADVEELNQWATLPSSAGGEYDLITAPIMSDPLGANGSAGAIQNGQFPEVMVIGPDLTVLEHVAQPTDAAVVEALDRHLGL